MAYLRIPTVIGGVAALSISLLVSVLLQDSSSSRLYCVHPDSPHSVRTLNASTPLAKCFRVSQGLFTEVLSSISDSATSIPGDDITWLDGYVLPGIIESHGHILQYGEMLESVSLYDSKSVAEMRERIKAFLRDREGEGWGTRNKWIRGIGWDQKFFGGVMPTAVCPLDIFLGFSFTVSILTY